MSKRLLVIALAPAPLPPPPPLQSNSLKSGRRAKLAALNRARRLKCAANQVGERCCTTIVVGGGGGGNGNGNGNGGGGYKQLLCCARRVCGDGQRLF